MHSADPTEGPAGGHARRLGNVLVHPGGEGTPGVQDFCLGEIAPVRGTGVTATSNALADVLDLQHRLPRTWSVLRAGEAEVYIARRVARLARHLLSTGSGSWTLPSRGSSPTRRAVGSSPSPRRRSSRPTPISDEGPSRATAFPADLLPALRTADLAPIAPKAVLYVHLHEAALAGSDAVARVEGLGPVSLSTLCRLLGRTRLTVRPVRDLSSRVRSTAYEHPESLKEQTYLRTGGDYWPFAASTSRRVDYVWLTPHGLAFLVDHLGTRPIDPENATAMFEAPDGVDLYFA